MKASHLSRLSPLSRFATPRSATPPDVSAEPRESVTWSESSSPPPAIWRQAGQALVWGGVAAASLAGAVPAQAQVQVRETPRPARGLSYALSREQVDQNTRNSVTATDMEAGQPHFTAWDVDPNQSTKWYHNPETMEVVNGYAGQTRPDGERFRMCARFNTSGECTGVIMNQVSYSVLSCIYSKQEDGQLYRVTHRSYQHQQTPAMQRNVCGGHELRHDGSPFASYAPYQVDRDGEQLFLNPAHILSVEPVQTLR